VDLQYETLTVFVLHDLTAKSSQGTAGDSNKAAGLQTFFTSHWKSRLNHSMDVPQLAFDLLLVVDNQGADDGLGPDSPLQVLTKSENIARKDDQMGAHEPALVSLAMFNLWEEIGDVVLPEFARHGLFRPRAYVIGLPSFRDTGLNI